MLRSDRYFGQASTKLFIASSLSLYPPNFLLSAPEKLPYPVAAIDINPMARFTVFAFAKDRSSSSII